MSSIEPYKGDLDRRTQRALVAKQRSWALEDFDNERETEVVRERLEAGSLMTGHLNFWIEGLSRQQDRLIEEGSTSAGRVGHTIDQLAINGANVIGKYMRGS